MKRAGGGDGARSPDYRDENAVDYDSVVLEDYLSFRDGRYGNPVTLTPLRAWVVATFFCILMIGGALFLGSTEYTRMQTVRGMIEPVGGFIAVTSPRDGVVQKILVQNGDYITSGASLIEIKSDTRFGQDRSLSLELLESTDNRLSAIKGQFRASDAIAQRSIESLYASERELHKRREHLNDELGIARERLAIDQGTLQAMAPLLEKGYVSVFRHREFEKQVLSDRQLVHQLSRELDELDTQLSRMPLQIQSAHLDRERQQAALDAQLAEHSGVVAQHRADAGTTIIADVSGRIEGLVAKKGTEPPRDCRRPQLLRGRVSYEQYDEQVFTRGSRAGGADGARS